MENEMKKIVDRLLKANNATLKEVIVLGEVMEGLEVLPDIINPLRELVKNSYNETFDSFLKTQLEDCEELLKQYNGILKHVPNLEAMRCGGVIKVDAVQAWKGYKEMKQFHDYVNSPEFKELPEEVKAGFGYDIERLNSSFDSLESFFNSPVVMAQVND